MDRGKIRSDRIMTERIRIHLLREKWSPRSVVKYIIACRRDEGVPMFFTKFAGIPFKIEDKPAVMVKCWAGFGRVESIVFTDVPHEEVLLIEERIGDWRMLLERFGTPEEKMEAYKYGIYIEGWRLPRIPK